MPVHLSGSKAMHAWAAHFLFSSCCSRMPAKGSRAHALLGCSHPDASLSVAVILTLPHRPPATPASLQHTPRPGAPGCEPAAAGGGAAAAHRAGRAAAGNATH